MRASPKTSLGLPATIALGLAALFAVFILPFFCGGHQQPVYSATYPLAAENRVATLALAALSFVVLLWTAWRTRGATEDRGGDATRVTRIARRTVVVGACLIACWTLALGLAVGHAHLRYGESAYFLERMRDMAASSGHIYTDVEFPYGPLLLLPRCGWRGWGFR